MNIKNLPNELFDKINDFGVVPISSDESLYDAIKKINSNFSLQLEYQAIITESMRRINKERQLERLTSYNTDNSIDVMYNTIREHYYSIYKPSIREYRQLNKEFGYEDMSHEYVIISGNVTELSNAISNEQAWIQLQLSTYSGTTRLVLISEHNSESHDVLTKLISYANCIEDGNISYTKHGGLVFELKYHELIYHDEFSEKLVEDMKNSDISIYDIASKQQQMYTYVKQLDRDIVELIDNERYNIVRVAYMKDDRNPNNHNIVITHKHSNGVSSKFFNKKSLDTFKGVVAYLDHPINRLVDLNEDKNSVYKLTRVEY